MDNIIFISIFTGIGIIFLFSAYRMIANFLEFKKRQSYVEKHIVYMTILDYYMEKAFDIIYKDRMLVYSVEGTKPDEELNKQNSIDFGKLTIKLLGPNLLQEFIFLYGDEETFMLTIMEYFNTRAEHDEIKEASINQIMEGNPDEII